MDSDNYSGRNFNHFNSKHGGSFAAVLLFVGGQRLSAKHDAARDDNLWAAGGNFLSRQWVLALGSARESVS
jgi:hypothetical protein